MPHVDMPIPGAAPAPALVRPPAYDAPIVTTGQPGALTRNEKLARDENINRALALTYKGHTTRQIGEMLGVSHATIERWVNSALEQAAMSRTNNVDALRMKLTNQIEWAISCLIPQVEAGKPFAVEKYLSGIDKIAKLWGVDAPIETKQLTLIAQLPADERVKRITELLFDNLPTQIETITISQEPYTTDLIQEETDTQ